MASATKGANVVGAIAGGEPQPVMLHNCISEDDLDRSYPSIVPPEGDHLDEIANDNADRVYQAGLRESREFARRCGPKVAGGDQ